MDEVERSEIWAIGDPICTSYQGSTAFPNRLYETTILYGNEGTHQRAVEYILNKFRSEEGGSLKRWLNGKFRAHRRATVEGKNSVQKEERRHFELRGNGVTSFYDPDRKVESFKIGQLRMMQYGLLDQMTTLIRSSAEKDLEQTIDDLTVAPRNVVKRLKFFESKGHTVDPREVGELIEAYEYFTWAYNVAQEEFQDRGLKELEFGKEEFETHQETILRIFSPKRKRKVLKF